MEATARRNRASIDRIKTESGACSPSDLAFPKLDKDTTRLESRDSDSKEPAAAEITDSTNSPMIVNQVQRRSKAKPTCPTRKETADVYERDNLLANFETDSEGELTSH